MSGIYSLPWRENILLAPAETFAYLLNMADPHAGWHTSAMDPHTARWYRSLIDSVRGYT